MTQTFVVPISPNVNGTNFFNTDSSFQAFYKDKLKLKDPPRILQLGSKDASEFSSTFDNVTAAGDCTITNPRIIAAAMTAASWDVSLNSTNYRRAGGPVAEFMCGNPLLGLLCLGFMLAGMAYNGYLKVKEIEEEKAKKTFSFYKELYQTFKNVKGGLEKDGTLDISKYLPEEAIWKRKYRSIKLAPLTDMDDCDQFFLVLDPTDSEDDDSLLENKPSETPFKDISSATYNHINTAFGITSMLYWLLWYVINSITLQGAFLTSTYGIYLGAGTLASVLSFAIGFGIPLAMGVAYLSLVLFNWNQKHFPPVSENETKLRSWIDYLFYKDITPFKASWQNLVFHILTGGVCYFIRYPLGLLFVLPLTVFNAVNYLIGKVRKKNVPKSREEGVELQSLKQQSELKTPLLGPEQKAIIVESKSKNSSLKVTDEVATEDTTNILKFLRELDHTVMINKIEENVHNLNKEMKYTQYTLANLEEKKLTGTNEEKKKIIDKELGLDCLDPGLLQKGFILLGAVIVFAIGAHNGYQFGIWYSLDFASAVGHPHDEVWSAGWLGLLVIVLSLGTGIFYSHAVNKKLDAAKEERKKKDELIEKIYTATKALEQRLKEAEAQEAMRLGETEDREDLVRIPPELSKRAISLLPSRARKVTFGEVIYYIFIGWMAAQSAIFVWRVVSYISGGLVLLGVIHAAAATAFVPWIAGAIGCAVFFAIVKVGYTILDNRRKRAEAILDNPEQHLSDLKKAREGLQFYLSPKLEDLALKIDVPSSGTPMEESSPATPSPKESKISRSGSSLAEFIAPSPPTQPPSPVGSFDTGDSSSVRVDLADKNKPLTSPVGVGQNSSTFFALSEKHLKERFKDRLKSAMEGSREVEVMQNIADKEKQEKAAPKREYIADIYARGGTAEPAVAAA